MGIVETPFPSLIANAMVRYLSENYPIPGKTVMFRPIRSAHVTTGRKGKALARIYFTEGPTVLARIAIGHAGKPVPDFYQATRIAHEYYHAVQVYRDDKVYQFPYDAVLEAEAIAFERGAVVAMMKELLKYIDPVHNPYTHSGALSN